MIIFKQLKTVQNVYFSYLEAGFIVYLSFRISKGSELEKWPNYPNLPYNVLASVVLSNILKV